MADIKYVSELNFKRGLKGVVDWIKEKYVRATIGVNGGGYAVNARFYSEESGYSMSFGIDENGNVPYISRINETTEKYDLAQTNELTTWSYSGNGETGSYIKLFGPEDSSARPILNFTKTDDGIYFSGNRDTGLAVGITGVNLADTDYVTVRSIKMNGVALTPDSNKVVEVNTGQLRISTAEGVQNQAQFAGYQNDGKENYAHFTHTTNGVRFTTGIDDNDATTGISVDLPDETRVQALIANELAGITGVDFVVVSALPATGEKGKFYLVANPTASGSNIYDEYVWVNKGTPETPDYAFERLGTMDVDLTDYTKETDFVALTNEEVDAVLVEIGVKTATPTP